MDAPSGNDAARLYAFEREKLGKVQGLLTESFTRVQQIMNKYSDEKYKEVIADFGQQFGAFRQAVTQVLSQPMPMGLRDPFQELANLQVERQQGYDKLNELNDEIQRLRDQNSGQNKLIEELQSQTKNRSLTNSEQQPQANGSGNPDDDPPYSSQLHFDDPQDTIVQLTNELETAQLNVGQLRRTADELTNHNKRLSVEVLQLRDQVNQSHNPYLNSNNLFDNGSHADSYLQNQSEIQGLNSVIEQLRIENGSLKEERRMDKAKIQDLQIRLENRGGQAKHLFRNDTVTDWNQDDLESLKKEMNRQKLALMTDRQMQVASGVEEPQPNMDSINEDNVTESEKHLFRANTKAEWDKNELDQLQGELMDQLKQQQREVLKQQFEKQMRFPEERRATNLVKGAEDLGQLTEEEMRARQQAMKEAMFKQKQQAIMQQTEKSMALREAQENQGMLQLDELDEASKLLMQMKQANAKQQLKQQLMKQDEFLAPVVEPTTEQYAQLDSFLKNTLGLLNENIRSRTINELKAVFSTGGKSSSGNNDASATRGHSEIGTPYAQTANGNVSNSLLDDDDIEISYPTPGGPTAGGGLTAGGLTDDGTTPGGPTPGGPIENQVAEETEWQRISEDQTKQISSLKQELIQKNEVINQLRYDIGVLESEINTLKNEKSQSNNENNNYNNNNRGNNNNNNNNNNSSRIESYNGDGRNINKDEVNELRAQIKELKDMKLQLIDSTAKEINHLRNLIRDMQKHISGEL